MSPFAPQRLRAYLHHNPEIAGAVLGIFLRAIRTTLRRTSPGASPDEETREVEGLASLVALRDAAVAKAMDADIKAIWDEKDRDRKAELVEAFKRRHAAHLDVLIDPDHPDLGPKNNQIVVAWGRLKDGRGDFYKRFAAALGTVKAHGHTMVCQGSLYFTCKAIGRPTRRTAASSCSWAPTSSRPTTVRPTAPRASRGTW